MTRQSNLEIVKPQPDPPTEQDDHERLERVADYVEAQIDRQASRRAFLKTVAERVLTVLTVSGLMWLIRVIVTSWEDDNG